MITLNPSERSVSGGYRVDVSRGEGSHRSSAHLHALQGESDEAHIARVRRGEAVRRVGLSALELCDLERPLEAGHIRPAPARQRRLIEFKARPYRLLSNASANVTGADFTIDDGQSL
jgi:hypothetical protein